MTWFKNPFFKTGLFLTAFFFACSDDSSSKAEPQDVILREVPTIYDLGACTADRRGDTVFVSEKAVDYLCVANNWVDITTLQDTSSSPDNQSEEPESGLSSFIDEGILSSSSFIEDPIRGDSDSVIPTPSINPNYAVVAVKEKLPACGSVNAKQRMLVQTDSVIYTCLSEKWEPGDSKGYIIKDASIVGAAQKGPFKVKSPLLLSEVLLRNDTLIYSGRKYKDEISSNKGDFVIPKVSLIYPYAVLEVRGQWRNEISGEYSRDSMTLRVLTDLSNRTEVNINLLTHLEYDRAVKLVNNGYNVYAAKTQAEHEIMTAFGFATTIEYSEELKTFIPSTNSSHNANATLMAISLLFIADKNDADIQKSINDFRSDFAEDGSWDNERMKANMADWAEAFDGGSIRANVKNWNILDVPKYENFLTIFWNNSYGLGGCDKIRYGVVSPVTNKSSKNYKVHYICKENGWIKASDYEKDTYEWKNGKDGDIKKGNVTATYYIFENGKWSVAKNETALGVCTTERNGELAKIDTIYFICRNGKWNVASVIEYDTYLFGIGKDGEVRSGGVNESNYYVYENGTWRASENEIENILGACVISRFGEIDLAGSTYYACKTNGWNEASVLEYDTYGWSAGTDDEVKLGNVISSNLYVYEDGSWRKCANDMECNYGVCTASRDSEKRNLNGKYYICENKSWKEITTVEYNLGYCSTTIDATVKLLNDVYYICKWNKWVEATAKDDTYSEKCSKDGAIVDGKVFPANKYVCDKGVFRTASEQEIALNKGCVSYTEKKEIRIQISEAQDSVYTCKTGLWIGSVERHYEILLDARDQKTYKTINIGTQTWMAENLNYSDQTYPGMLTQSWCYDNISDSCVKYGRLYAWSVAMDSAGIFSTNGKGCGWKEICSPIYPVRGICPEGWHLPSVDEFRTLITTVGGDDLNLASKSLKSDSGWCKFSDSCLLDGEDSFGFSALPSGWLSSGGYFGAAGETAMFWSSTKDYSNYAYIMCLNGRDGTTDGLLRSRSIAEGIAIRCIKD